MNTLLGLLFRALSDRASSSNSTHVLVSGPTQSAVARAGLGGLWPDSAFPFRLPRSTLIRDHKGGGEFLPENPVLAALVGALPATGLGDLLAVVAVCRASAAS